MHMITNEGLLYSIGKDYNNYGILGMGDLVHELNELTLNNFFLNIRIKNISICEKYCVCINSKFNILIFGIFNNKKYSTPKSIKNESEYYYDKIKASNNYFAILDVNGILTYYGYIKETKKINEDERIIHKKIDFDYNTEEIDDFICLENYICILSNHRNVFLYNESGLYKIQINDSINNIYKMKNCIFLFSTNKKIIHILEYNNNNFISKTYKINDNIELLGVVHNYIYNPHEIIFKFKGNYFQNITTIFTLIFSNTSNEENNLILKNNFDNNKILENYSYMETQSLNPGNSSLIRLSQSLGSLRGLSYSNSLSNFSRIDKISKMLERIFDNKLNEIKRKRSCSANRRIYLEKIIERDNEYSYYDNKNYLTRSYKNVFNQKLSNNFYSNLHNDRYENLNNNLVNIETFGNENLNNFEINENNSNINNDDNNNEKIENKNKIGNISFKNLEEIENKLKKTSKNNFIIQNFKIRYTSRNNNSSIPKIVEKKIVNFNIEKPDNKLKLYKTKINNNILSLDSIIQLHNIEHQKKKEIELIKQKQKEKDEEINKLKEIQLNQQIEFLMIKKFNEEKDKELKRLKDTEKEKELEIEKQTEILKNLKLQQKSRQQFLMIDQISNCNIEKNLNTPKNLQNPLINTISKSIKLSTPQIEENNFLYKSLSNFEEQSNPKKKKQFLIRSNSQIFEVENKNIKPLFNSKNKKEYSGVSSVNSSFNTFKKKPMKKFKGKNIIIVPSKEVLFNIIKNKQIDSLDTSIYYQVQNENDTILKYKSNKFEIIKLNEIKDNNNKGKTERILNRVNSSSNNYKKNKPVRLCNSIVLNSSNIKKKSPLSIINNTNNSKNLNKKVMKRSYSSKKFSLSKYYNNDSSQKLIFQSNNNGKSFERSITPLKLISQKSSNYIPSNLFNKKNNEDNINIDKLTDKYIHFLQKKYGEQFIDENLKNYQESDLIKDFMNNEIINNNDSEFFISNNQFSSISEMEKFMNEHLKFENIKNKLKEIDNNLLVENFFHDFITYEEEEKNFIPFEPIELDYSIISKK